MNKGFLGKNLKIAQLSLLVLIIAGLLTACGNEAPSSADPTPPATTKATPVASLTAPATTAGPVVTVNTAAPTQTTLADATTITVPTAALAPSAAPTQKNLPAIATPAPAASPDFSGQQAYTHVRELAGTIGVRAAGTEGERKGADYIENYFKGLGLRVERPQVSYTLAQDKGSTASYQAATGPEVKLQGFALGMSGNGKIAAGVGYIGLGLDGQVVSGSLKGKIALVERGQIPFSQKVKNALGAGAGAVIVYNNQEGELDSATLGQKVSVPVLGLNRAGGEGLRQALRSNPGLNVNLNVDVRDETITMSNVIAQRPALSGGENAPLLIIGGHFDSVPAGPGANDNASGTAVVLELARSLQQRYPAYELRFAAFSGEEIGLVGSNDYVQKLSAADRQRLVAMINIDMISVGTQFWVGGKPELTRLALGAAQNEGLNTQVMPKAALSGSDSFSFDQAGLPTLFLNRLDDPNYHRPEDTADKVPPERLGQVGRVVMKVIDGLPKI